MPFARSASTSRASMPSGPGPSGNGAYCAVAAGMRRTAVHDFVRRDTIFLVQDVVLGEIEAGVERTRHLAPGAETRQGLGERLLLRGLTQLVQLGRTSASA